MNLKKSDLDFSVDTENDQEPIFEATSRSDNGREFTNVENQTNLIKLDLEYFQSRLKMITNLFLMN